MTKTGSIYAWVAVTLLGTLVSPGYLLSSQLTNSPDPCLRDAAQVGDGDTCSLGDAVDAPQLTWTAGGFAPWMGSTGLGYDGVDAAQSGAIGANQDSWLETTVQGPCKVTYWRSVSSESDADFLRFYVDGVEQPGGLSGEVAWQQQTTVVGDGAHALRWVYSKNSTVSNGADAAWVDQVRVTEGSDTDGDRLADTWEWRYFGSLDTATTNSDWDQDKFGDISEYGAGTDPTNRHSYLGLNAIVILTQTGSVVRWPSVTGIVYRLDCSTNLPTDFSTLLDRILATPPENVCTDSVAGVAVKFYRVAISDEMVFIPAGTNSGTDPDFGAYSLTVAAFCMDKYPVTKAKWDDVYGWAVAHGYAFDYVGSGKRPDHPVQMVNWYDCIKWCNARSEREGRAPCYRVSGAVYRTNDSDAVVCDASVGGYRLPTDVEFQCAARGGLIGKRFPWGDTIDHETANYYGWVSGQYYDLGYAGYDMRYAVDGYPYTSPVGSFEAGKNAYGLYDMTGNVWEWCGDWYPGLEGSSRVLRGGSWYEHADACRIGDRKGYSPADAYSDFGFRAVLSPDP